MGDDMITFDDSDGFFSIGVSIVPVPSITSVVESPISAGEKLFTIYGKNLFYTVPSGIEVEFLQGGIVKGRVRDPAISIDGSSLTFSSSDLSEKNITPGVYQIRVVNDNGVSNTLDFTFVSSPGQ